jgi:hypothetical protein
MRLTDLLEAFAEINTQIYVEGRWFYSLIVFESDGSISERKNQIFL